MFEDIKSGLTWLGNFISSAIDSACSKVISIIKDIPDFILSLPKTIFNFFKDLIQDIVFGVKNIFEFLGGLIDAFLQLFKDIFIPSDGYFTKKFKSLSDLLEGKFSSNVDAIETLKNSSSTESITNHTITVMGATVDIKFDFISKVKPVCNAIFLGLGGIFLAWYNYRKVYQLIRGTAPISGNNPTGGGGSDDN